MAMIQMIRRSGDSMDAAFADVAPVPLVALDVAHETAAVVAQLKTFRDSLTLKAQKATPVEERVAVPVGLADDVAWANHLTAVSKTTTARMAALRNPVSAGVELATFLAERGHPKLVAGGPALGVPLSKKTFAFLLEPAVVEAVAAPEETPELEPDPDGRAVGDEDDDTPPILPLPPRKPAKAKPYVSKTIKKRSAWGT
jgi:hypothetical protein